MENSISKRGEMAEAKFYESYARYSEDLGRYETWEEAVDRAMDMHRKKYNDKMSDELSALFDSAAEGWKRKDCLGAQRVLQYGGDQLLDHQMRLYNCTASYCDRAEFFGETLYALLCGAGVGFSVQKHHVAKLPDLVKNKGKRAKTFIIPDSIEGWAESLDVLLSSYFVGGGKHPEYEGCHVSFDFSQIRPKGAFISGGFKAPGPDPLRRALGKIEDMLNSIYKSENRLKPIHAYDIVMHAADAVIAGGKINVH